MHFLKMISEENTLLRFRKSLIMARFESVTIYLKVSFLVTV